MQAQPFIIILTLAIAAGLVFVGSTGAQQGESSIGHTLQQCTRIDVEQVVSGPAADVWACWSTSEGAQTFLAPKANIEPHPGGPFEIWFMPDAPPGQRGAEDLKVLSALPGEMISFEWSAPPQFPHARPQRTWVVVTLTPVDGAHTKVRLVHLGWDEMKAENPGHEREWDDVRAYFEQAWPYVLGNLKKRFDEGPRWDATGQSLWKE